MKRIIDVLEDLLIKPRDPQRKGPENAQGRWATLTVPFAVVERAKALLEDLRQCEPVAVRYGFDGYGFAFIDNGSGSDWLTRYPDGEPLFVIPEEQRND
jgi:hypothetical protein